MRILTVFALALVSALGVRAEIATQTWNAVSAEWSTTAPNWDDGAVWGQSNCAVFAESTITNIVVPGTTFVTRLDFEKNNWSLSGDGPILSRLYDIEVTDPNMAEGSISVCTSNDVEIAIPMMTAVGGNFNKYGAGKLTLKDDALFFRGGIYAGTLSIVNAMVTTAKFFNYAPNKSSTYVAVHLDGAKLAPVNANIMFGESGHEFNEITVGAGGVTFTNNPAFNVGAVRIKHPMRPADDLGDAIDGGVTVSGGYNFFIASETCDLQGGFKFLSGTSYLRHAAGVGTGPIYLDTPLYSTNFVTFANPTAAMILPNDIIFGTNGALGLVGEAGHIEFTNVTFAAGNDSRRVALASKTGGGTARYAASAESVPFGGFSLSGGIGLKVDGDTWTAHSGAVSPFISVSAAELKPVEVATGGLVIDTNGRDISLGASLVFTPLTITNWFDETMFNNGSFESGTTGWTFTGGKAGSSDVRDNNSAFSGAVNGKPPVPAYQTSYGTHYAQVRSSSSAENKFGSIATTFRVPDSGEWHIAFEYANRQGNYDPSGLLQWKVTVDGNVLHEMSNDGLGNHGFITYHSPAVMLETGVDHTFKFETGEYVEMDHGYDSMLVDAVRLMHSDAVEIPRGSFTKKGLGTLVVPYLDKPGAVNVQAGRLEVDGLFESNTVNVAAGAVFAFRSSSEVYIPNSSFEEGTYDVTDGISYAGEISGWTLEGGVTSTTRAGWQKNGGKPTENGGPYTTNGFFTAYLRPECSMATSVYVPHDGIYELSFEQASRWGSETSSLSRGILLTITVTIDGNEVLVVPPRNITGPVREEFNRVSAVVTLPTGYHSLKIETDDADGTLPNGTNASSGTMVFIDNVRLVASKVDFADLGATWNFAAGATVDVGDADIELDKVYVNGVRIRGGANTFRAVGLNVLGTGSFRSGPPSGLRVFIK